MNKPFLREPTGDAAALAAQYQHAENQYQASQGETRLRWLGELGTLARYQGHLHLAQQHFQAAIELALEQQLPQFVVANRIRLGVAQQYADQHPAAEQNFRQALQESEDWPQAMVYKDFALQHLGKLLAELGMLAEAELCLLGALKLREQKRDTELIASSRHALQALQKLRHQGTLFD